MLLMLLLFSVLEEKVGEKLAMTRRRGNAKYNSKDRKERCETKRWNKKRKKELIGTKASGKMMAVEKMKRAEENKGVCFFFK